VRGVGTDAAVVEGGTVQEEADPEQASTSVSAKSLEGRPVLNEAGVVLGKVADVLVDPRAMTIPALLLSTGLLDNVLHGKPQLPLGIVKAVGKDSVLVPTSYDPRAAVQPTQPE
jgi:uncharacterized protein YrrD